MHDAPSLDFPEAVARESARFLEVVRDTMPAADVPSCPDWTMADLTWHLAEVQHFWGSIVAELAQDPDEVTPIERPENTALPGLFAEASGRLVEALRTQPASAPCWTWNPADQTVGFVARRQAHEALIHRVDAELGAGARTPIDVALAADGVDEVVDVFVGGVPDWATFEPDGRTARFMIGADGLRRRTVAFGRFRGTSPTSGNDYDFDTFDPIGDAPDDEVDVEIAGSAVDLDLWLWGRSDVAVLALAGDRTLADRIRVIAADTMQ